MHGCVVALSSDNTGRLSLLKRDSTEPLYQPHFSISATPACKSPALVSYRNHRIGISLGFKQPLSIKINIETKTLQVFKCPFLAKQQLGS